MSVNESLTGDGNYFEDFVVGSVFYHARGRTITNSDNIYWSLTTLNTAQPHYNIEYAQKLMGGEFPERLVMGGLTIAIIVGLTSEDMAENSVADLRYDKIQLHAPVFDGDTVYASSRVVRLDSSHADPALGVIEYEWRGWKSPDIVVATGNRTMQIRRSSEVREMSEGS